MMGEIRRTPGDWGFEDPMGPDILHIVANPEAEAYDWIFVAQIGTSKEDGDRRSLAEHKANAHILAAAPALYAALKGMLRHSCVADAHPADKDPDDHAAESAALRALSKAEGGKP